MNPLSVIIPSRTLSNLKPCVAAVRKHDPDAFICVVDDSQGMENAEFCTADEMVLWVKGVKPFIYARNCNLGIRCESEPEMNFNPDFILLNDDALLETPGGFSAMQKAAEEHPEYGIISSTTNVAGNVDQYKRAGGMLRDAGAKCVAFVCVLIPRRTLDTVGMLDERFTAYGWEDNDYCRRVRNAGLKVGIFDGCFVDHSKLKSTFRGAANAAGDIGAGREIYQAKWGDLA